MTTAAQDFVQKVTAWEKCNLNTMSVNVTHVRRCVVCGARGLYALCVFSPTSSK